MSLLLLSITFLMGLFIRSHGLSIQNSMEGNITLTSNDDGSTNVVFLLDGVLKMSGKIGIGLNLVIPELDECEAENKCTIQGDGGTLTISAVNSGFSINWSTTNLDTVFQDCFDLKIGEWHWYGGPEKWQQDWPIETSLFVDRPYIPIKTDNGAVAERYWLNSVGGWIFIEDEAPLFLDQNNLVNGSICYISKIASPYVKRSEIVFEYRIAAKVDVYRAHLHAVNVDLGSPRERPSNWMIRNPIWTTWAKYKKEINDDVVLAFAQDIADHGFTGQIEIDEMWESCFGTLTFSEDKFSNIAETVQAIKDLGFTVALWTHPFVNIECEEPLKIGLDNDYFVKSINSSLATTWWEGTAHFLDFTNSDAKNWWVQRLNKLKEQYGIDSFKFDSGESDYPPPNPVFANGNPELTPGLSTNAYIDTCSSFGNNVEVRSAWRNQLKLIFVRMIDKDSRWTINNGLASLITTLLNLNLQGYHYVLPDMIGGNGYGDELPSAELLVRWIQANTFMPVMQFSYLPWDTPSDDFDIVAITQKFVNLHLEYATTFEAAINRTISLSQPVNPPIWWVDPTNEDALKVNDEFLLGDYILVAPVIHEGATSRDVVLPAGIWEDGNDGTFYEGPQTIKSYPAPIDVLPYFIKHNDTKIAVDCC